jgi:hypothetical protein
MSESEVPPEDGFHHHAEKLRRRLQDWERRKRREKWIVFFIVTGLVLALAAFSGQFMTSAQWHGLLCVSVPLSLLVGYSLSEWWDILSRKTQWLTHVARTIFRRTEHHSHQHEDPTTDPDHHEPTDA